MNEVIIDVTHMNAPFDSLEGKTYQIHHLGGGRFRLVLVEIIETNRCPVMIKGEQCGRSQGHKGKHMWGRGD